ncbi:MAG: prepilin peptidase, partial [Anaerolineae bacterium]
GGVCAAVLTLVLFLSAPWDCGALLFCVTACTVADVISREIPDVFVLIGCVTGIAAAAAKGSFLSGLGWGVLGLVTGTLLNVLAELLFGQDGFGMGDAKALGMLGIWLGRQWWEMFFFACLLGSLWGGLLMVLKGKREGVTIPFFPFLGAGAGLVISGLSQAGLNWWMTFIAARIVGLLGGC